MPGIAWSAERRAAQAVIQRERMADPVARERIATAKRGKPLSPETRRRMSEVRKGKGNADHLRKWIGIPNPKQIEALRAAVCIQWTPEMMAAEAEMRKAGMSMPDIAAKLGVSATAYRKAVKRGVFPPWVKQVSRRVNQIVFDDDMRRIGREMLVKGATRLVVSEKLGVGLTTLRKAIKAGVFA